MSGEIKKTVLFTLKVALLLSPILLAVGFISFVEWVNPVSGHQYIFGNIDIKTIRYNPDARRFDFEVLLANGRTVRSGWPDKLGQLPQGQLPICIAIPVRNRPTRQGSVVDPSLCAAPSTDRDCRRPYGCRHCLAEASEATLAIAHGANQH